MQNYGIQKHGSWYDISYHFNEILKSTPFFEFFDQKTALLTPALLTPALISATRKNNADLGQAL